MNEWWQLALSVTAALAILWISLIVTLLIEQRRHPQRATLGDLLRLLPDVIRLLKRIATDRATPIASRIWLAVLLVYLVSPIDLIPDFIPVLGFADDALVVAIAVRVATRSAGTAAVERLWPGTTQGLAVVLRFAGLGSLQTKD